MISGEYLVLDGAECFAVPTRFGQSLQINSKGSTKPNIHWKAYENNFPWFEAVFSNHDFAIQNTSDQKTAKKLAGLFLAARNLNPGFISHEMSYQAETHLEFQRNWGLGSSSSLISNIAYWANVDPFELHFSVSEGSAYDLACARAEHPIIYSIENKKPRISKVTFKPDFRDKIYFVFSGQKQDSNQGIKNYRRISSQNFPESILKMTNLSRGFAKAKNIEEFNSLIREHENLVAEITGFTSIKQKRFPDFEGEIKSLGAWGGDFLMLTYEGSRTELQKYLTTKGINTVFGFNEILKA
jgi:mevalonate kinase